MKFIGHKINGVTYLVSDAEIEKAGSLENAAKEAKAKIDAKKNPKPEKVAKVKKVSEQPEENPEIV